MNNPLVSVVIVVYNAGSTIGQAMESVLHQTYRNVELLVIDGGSKDNTLEVIAAYQSRIGYFISEEDKGIYDAMNKGIAAAKGDWILFLGADDAFYTDTVLEKIFENADLGKADLLYGDVEFSSNKRRYGAEKNYNRLIEQNICHQAIFYSRKLFQSWGNYNTRYSILADYEMNLRLFRLQELEMRYIPIVITLFNDKGASNVSIDRYFHEDMLRYFLLHEKIPFTSPLLQQYHFYYGYICLFNKEALKGVKHIMLSWFFGKRKLFFFLLTGKFLLNSLGNKKIKIK